MGTDTLGIAAAKVVCWNEAVPVGATVFVVNGIGEIRRTQTASRAYTVGITPVVHVEKGNGLGETCDLDMLVPEAVHPNSRKWLRSVDAILGKLNDGVQAVQKKYSEEQPITEDLENLYKLVFGLIGSHVFAENPHLDMSGERI